MKKEQEERKSPGVQQYFVPHGAVALLPLTLSLIHNHAKQGNGYRGPHIALEMTCYTFRFMCYGLTDQHATDGRTDGQSL